MDEFDNVTKLLEDDKRDLIEGVKALAKDIFVVLLGLCSFVVVAAILKVSLPAPKHRFQKIVFSLGVWLLASIASTKTEGWARSQIDFYMNTLYLIGNPDGID